MKRLLYYLRYDWPLHFVMILTSWLPDNVVFFRLRGMLARPFFGSCGTDLRVGRNVTFYNASSIYIGSHVYVAIGCVFLGVGNIEIGDEILFGPYVVLSSGNHTKYQGSYRYGKGEEVPIKIGSGSWIGAHTTVLGGATIGRGCVIGSNAAVARGIIPDNAFAAGVPAIVKRVDTEDDPKND
jgi:acetyltransferase-like isoleucine patch superfamily enzyme